MDEAELELEPNPVKLPSFGTGRTSLSDIVLDKDPRLAADALLGKPRIVLLARTLSSAL